MITLLRLFSLFGLLVLALLVWALHALVSSAGDWLITLSAAPFLTLLFGVATFIGQAMVILGGVLASLPLLLLLLGSSLAGSLRPIRTFAPGRRQGRPPAPTDDNAIDLAPGDDGIYR